MQVSPFQLQLSDGARLAQTLGRYLQAHQYCLSTAESCTAGGVAQAITDVAGSSAYFDRGFVTYSNQSKRDLLSVSEALLRYAGAVSEPVAIAMAKGALRRSQANASLAVTGIAGPGGGSASKPVGLVWFAFAAKNTPAFSISKRFSGDRIAVRKQAIVFAMQGLLDYLMT